MMRSKDQIVNDLKKTKQDQISTYYAGTPSEMITIEVLIDIRDLLSHLILGSVEGKKMAHHGG